MNIGSKLFPALGLVVKNCVTRAAVPSAAKGLAIPHVRKYAVGVSGSGDFIFRQLLDYNTYTYTYLLADKASKEAVLVDPVIQMVDRDIKLAEELGVEILFGINTHMHADHITGTGLLKKKLKNFQSVIAKYTSAKADIYVDDGQLIKFGQFQLECRSTPGHTDGCMTYVLHEKEMAFTGDALLIRGCGRTDFQQGSPSKLYESCHKKILSLPEQFLLYPGHDYKGMMVTTVAEEKKLNPRLTKSLKEFTEIMKNLNLGPPKYLNEAIPANLNDGLVEEVREKVAK